MTNFIFGIVQYLSHNHIVANLKGEGYYFLTVLFLCFVLSILLSNLVANLFAFILFIIRKYVL